MPRLTTSTLIDGLSNSGVRLHCFKSLLPKHCSLPDSRIRHVWLPPVSIVRRVAEFMRFGVMILDWSGTVKLGIPNKGLG